MFPPLNLPLYICCLLKEGFYSAKREGIDAFFLTFSSGTCVVEAAAAGGGAWRHTAQLEGLVLAMAGGTEPQGPPVLSLLCLGGSGATRGAQGLPGPGVAPVLVGMMCSQSQCNPQKEGGTARILKYFSGLY